MDFEFAKWLENRVIVESMDVRVDDMPQEQELDTLGDISSYLQNKLLGNYIHMGFMSPENQKKAMQGNKMMAPDDIAHYMKNRPTEQFSPDGDSDYFGNSGIINFYYQGLPQSKVQQFMQAAKFLLDEIGVKYGQFKAEDWQAKYNKDRDESEEQGDYESERHDGSDKYDYENYIKYTSSHADRMKQLDKWYKEKADDMSEIRVVRIPILSIPNKVNQNSPPKLNMANGNAYHIFHDVLDMKQYGEEGGYFGMPAADLIMKIDMMQANPRGREAEDTGGPGTDKARFISMGLDSNQIDQRLMTIRQIAQWALDNGYSTISAV